mmetsp:Transcript_7409/g.12302  ORF Transcript_7409/g.12302 Transcript_7409/m.12302 type:complete len:92 (-) Transcript_7409:585-860(-)
MFLYFSSLFSLADQIHHIDLGLVFVSSALFVSNFIADAGAATAVGDDGAFTEVLFIDTPRADGNGKVGNVEGSNLVPSGRRLDVFVGGVVS